MCVYLCECMYIYICMACVCVSMYVYIYTHMYFLFVTTYIITDLLILYLVLLIGLRKYMLFQSFYRDSLFLKL